MLCATCAEHRIGSQDPVPDRTSDLSHRRRSLTFLRRERGAASLQGPVLAPQGRRKSPLPPSHARLLHSRASPILPCFQSSGLFAVTNAAFMTMNAASNTVCQLPSIQQDSMLSNLQHQRNACGINHLQTLYRPGKHKYLRRALRHHIVEPFQKGRLVGCHFVFGMKAGGTDTWKVIPSLTIDYNGSRVEYHFPYTALRSEKTVVSKTFALPTSEGH